MPWQLIYTSAPRGLVSGQSGFCTVARSADLRDALAQRLEQISSYHYLELPGAGNAPRNPVISAYRVLDIRGAKYHVLTRILPCGLDFTARTNHLAQHLAFAPDELAQLPSPAAILRHWKGWLGSWQAEPRVLDPLAPNAFKELPAASWPAANWLRLTGDAGRAAGLLESECVRGCFLLCPSGGEQELLDLFCETLQLPNYTGKYPLRAWQHTFTTFLQAEDAVADFQWRGCQAGTPAYRQAVNRSATILQLRNLRVPNNLLVKLAREGPEVPRPAAPPPPPRPALALRKEASSKPTPPRSSIDFSHTEFPRQRPRASRAGGLVLTIKKTSLRAILITLVLITLILLVPRYFSHRRPRAPDRIPPAPGVTETKPAATPSAPPPTGGAEAGPRRIRVDPDQLNLELADALEDVQTFLFVQPALAASNSLTIGGVGPLGGLLRNFNQFHLHSNDVEAELSFDSWGLSEARHLELQSNPRGGGGTLVAKDAAGETVVFNYSDSGNGQSLQLQAQFNRAPSAFAMVFRPASIAPKTFESFRLLVINESKPPPALSLHNHFLFAGPIHQGALKMLEEPLSKRLQWVTPMVKDGGQAAWQLWPFVTAKPPAPAKDLWRDVLQRQPERGQELDFPALRKGLTAQLEDLTNQVAMLARQLSDLAAKTPSNVDFSLPLGNWLELTNGDLASFAAYTNASHAARISPDLFKTYLRSVTRKGRAHQHWLPGDDDAEHWLDNLYEKCLKHLPAETNKLLTLNGPTQNYFLAGVQALEAAEKQREWLKQKQEKEREAQRLLEQLALIPRSWEQTAYLKLNYLGPDGPLEAIRFSDFSDHH
jgi:hypothetical protein